MADPRFIGLVASIRSSAEAALGETDSPMVTRLARDGALARRTAERSVELLEMLEHKTHGNLDETERDALHRALAEIRGRLAAVDGDADSSPPSGADGALPN